MVCKYCGSSYEEKDKFCPICGKNVNGEVPAASPSVTVNNGTVVGGNGVEEAIKESKNGLATAALVLGILAILGFGTQIAGIILGVFGLKSNKRGNAIAGIVLSIVSVVLAVVFFALFFIIWLTAIVEAVGSGLYY